MKQKTMRLSLALIKTRECSRSLLTTACAALLLSSCTARIHEIPIEEEPGVPVQITVASIEQEPFAPFGTKAAATLSDACSVISYGIYSADGQTKIKDPITQKADDNSNFGTINLRLEEGVYKLVILAHSCPTGVTLSNIKEIKFPSGKSGRASDAFLYYSDLTVSRDMQPVNINLNRVVAKIEFKLVNGAIPSQVETMEFSLATGVSGNLNATTGRSASNSNGYSQVFSDVTPNDSVFDLYTFVCPDATSMKLTIKASDGSGAEYKSMTITDIPVAINRRTICKVTMFDKVFVDTDASIVIDNDWAGTDEYVFPNNTPQLE